MRKLAGTLGYEVMSLYNHVENKDDLLDGVVDLVAAQIGEPLAHLPWKSAVREIAMSAHAALVRHPWAAGMWATRWPAAPCAWSPTSGITRSTTGGATSSGSCST